MMLRMKRRMKLRQLISPDPRQPLDDIVVIERADPAVSQLVLAIIGAPGAKTRRVAGRALWCLIGDQGFYRGRQARDIAVRAAWFAAHVAATVVAEVLEAKNAFASRGRRYVVFTSPDQAPLAKLFRRRTGVYYVFDDFVVGHDYWSKAQVQNWEQQLVDRCSHTVAVSTALAAKLERRLKLPPGYVDISPNAVPASAIPSSCPEKPVDIDRLPGRSGLTLRRPVVGILGSVSSRLRLGWIRHAVESIPSMTFLFAGWLDEVEILEEDREHLAWLRAQPSCHFTGPQTYEELLQWAACVDVALLPYSDRSVNPQGSSVRFFLQLPFGQPILATPGCRQLEEFDDVLTMCRSKESLVEELGHLERVGFDDGRCQLRWQTSQAHTWECRAASLVALLRDGQSQFGP
jgi:hypothetical protein